MQLCIEFRRGSFRDIDLVAKNVEFELKRNNVLSKWDVGNNDLAYFKKMFKFWPTDSQEDSCLSGGKNETLV